MENQEGDGGGLRHTRQIPPRFESSQRRRTHELSPQTTHPRELYVTDAYGLYSPATSPSARTRTARIPLPQRADASYASDANGSRAPAEVPFPLQVSARAFKFCTTTTTTSVLSFLASTMLRSRVSSALASAARTARPARPPPPSLLQLRQPRQQKPFTAPGLLQKHFISSTSCAQSGPGGASRPAPPPSSAPGTPAVASSPDAAASPHASQPQEPRLSLTFTCTVSECGTRSTHEFTRRSYQKGIVIVKCPGCENKLRVALFLLSLAARVPPEYVGFSTASGAL